MTEPEPQQPQPVVLPAHPLIVGAGLLVINRKLKAQVIAPASSDPSPSPWSIDPQRTREASI